MQGTLVIMFQAAEAPKGGHSHSGEEGPQGRMETVQAAGVGRLQSLRAQDLPNLVAHLQTGKNVHTALPFTFRVYSPQEAASTLFSIPSVAP